MLLKGGYRIMKELLTNTRDVARELARKYSTMTHEELDQLESILVPLKFAKNEMILKEGQIDENIMYVAKGLVRQFYFKKERGDRAHDYRGRYGDVYRKSVP